MICLKRTTVKSADSIIYPTNKIIENMELTLFLNSRLQPMHRHDLEDALQEILEKIKKFDGHFQNEIINNESVMNKQ